MYIIKILISSFVAHKLLAHWWLIVPFSVVNGLKLLAVCLFSFIVNISISQNFHPVG